MTSAEKIILVDDQDQILGNEEKLKAHQLGLLHRAFSVFILRKKSKHIEVLLQQRQWDKYHCGGLWTNTCCGHPRPGESITDAAQRRLQEEMGIFTTLKTIGVFQYIAHFENGLTENEIDHVLIGQLIQPNFVVNNREVADYRWVNLVDLSQLVVENSHNYTPWLKPAIEIVQHETKIEYYF